MAGFNSYYATPATKRGYFQHIKGACLERLRRDALNTEESGAVVQATTESNQELLSFFASNNLTEDSDLGDTDGTAQQESEGTDGLASSAEENVEEEVVEGEGEALGEAEA